VNPLELNARLQTAAAVVREEPLDRPQRWTLAGSPDPALVNRSIQFVLSRIDQNLETFTEKFPAPSSIAGVYAPIDNVEWTNGFWTGLLWLAYELSGEPRYARAAQTQVASFQKRVEQRVNVDHHDLGFLYTLSCVSAHKLTGDESAKQAALQAAQLLFERYLPNAGIIQAWGDLSDSAQRGRMIIDCNLNLPLLYWAADTTGNEDFRFAADAHISHAAAHLVRPDASTFHTFYMGAQSGAPLGGRTHQGYSDSSCWSRGQAWGISGFPLVYRYRPVPALIELTKKLANYFLNRLPDDGICYWDLIFTSGSEQRDSSAAAIAACGLLEVAKALPSTDPHRQLYQDAAWTIIKELSLHYQATSQASNGILQHAVYHMPNRIGVNECCIWGDYFYLEALVRLSRVWQPYW
jgi:unsaturated chondroitin disaccharide hydrolase